MNCYFIVFMKSGKIYSIHNENCPDLEEVINNIKMCMCNNLHGFCRFPTNYQDQFDIVRISDIDYLTEINVKSPS